MLRTSGDFTPPALTILLRQAGVLPRGQVEQVAVEEHPADLSGRSPRLFHLTITYGGLPPASSPPPRLFLKFGNSRKEYTFYTEIAPDLGIPPLLRCYYAVYDPEVDQTCLLLEDLSATHAQSPWPLPPPTVVSTQVVRSLAEIHARWWNHPRLEASLRPALPPGRSWADRNAQALENLPAFLQFLGDRLSPRQHAIMERLRAVHPRPWEAPPRHQTLLHGDLHYWNVLVPRDPARDALRFIDWNGWDIGRPTDDLAYLIALHGSPARRAWLERDLLQAYHARLEECGIYGYAWDMLWQDYRLSVIRTLLIPAWQWVRGIQPVIWWPHLERGLAAFEDLDCAEILLEDGL